MTDYKLSKADKAVLASIEVHLERAKNDYVRGFYTTDFDAVAPIYAKFGLHVENKHCSTCILNMLKFLANKYYNNGKL